MGNPRIAAEQYLKKYNIPDLFDYLLSQIVINMPEDPWTHLSEICEKLDSRSFQDNIPFFTRDEINIVFSNYEVLNRGYITGAQAKQALKTMGLKPRIVDDLFIDDDANLSREEFSQYAVNGFNKRLNSWLGKYP